MNTNATHTADSELHDPEYVAALKDYRETKVRFGLALSGLVLVVLCGLFGGLNPLVGLVLVGAAVSVLVTAAASYRMGEPYWWLRIVCIFAAVQAAGGWIIGLV